MKAADIDMWKIVRDPPKINHSFYFAQARAGYHSGSRKEIFALFKNERENIIGFFSNDATSRHVPCNDLSVRSGVDTGVIVSVIIADNDQCFRQAQLPALHLCEPNPIWNPAVLEISSRDSIEFVRTDRKRAPCPQK